MEITAFDRLSDGVSEPLLERAAPAGSRRAGPCLYKPSISHSVSWSSLGANASLSGATDFESDQDSNYHTTCTLPSERPIPMCSPHLSDASLGVSLSIVYPPRTTPETTTPCPPHPSPPPTPHLRQPLPPCGPGSRVMTSVLWRSGR
ncbi:unnamed protein product [Gadus morhua 'NCC']